ncbi:hypothetical protein THAOC_14496, partial [Thalassiosira oceanica]
DSDWTDDDSVCSDTSSPDDSSPDDDVEALLGLYYERSNASGQRCSFCEEPARYKYVHNGRGCDGVCVCEKSDCQDDLLLEVDERFSGAGVTEQTAPDAAPPLADSDTPPTTPRLRRLPSTYHAGNDKGDLKLNAGCDPPADWRKGGVYPEQWVTFWKKWKFCETILLNLPTKSGDSLELVPPWIPWHIRDKSQQKCVGMVLHYAPLELIQALDESTWGVGGHPSAVFCEVEEEPVSQTWALWYRAFENPDDYCRTVKANAEPMFYAYGGSPLDDLTEENYIILRDAYKPVLEYLMENFVTALLSRAVFVKVKSMFGGKKGFESFVKDNRDNFLSLDRSYEDDTARSLNQSLAHLARRRRGHADLLGPDHPECIHNSRLRKYLEEQCNRFDAFGTKLVREVSGSDSSVVTVGRDIFKQGVTTRRNLYPNGRRNRHLLSAAILVGSSTKLTFDEAMQCPLRIQVKCSRNRSFDGELEQSLLFGTKLLTRVDPQTGGDGNIAEQCAKIIVSALTEKENETQQRHWSIEEVDCLMKLEQELHDCRNRFDLIALAIPGKSSDQCRRKWKREKYRRIKLDIDGGVEVSEEERKFHDDFEAREDRKHQRQRDDRAKYRRIQLDIDGGVDVSEEERKFHDDFEAREERIQNRALQRRRDDLVKYRRIKKDIDSEVEVSEEERRFLAKYEAARAKANERSLEWRRVDIAEYNAMRDDEMQSLLSKPDHQKQQLRIKRKAILRLKRHGVDLALNISPGRLGLIVNGDEDFGLEIIDIQPACTFAHLVEIGDRIVLVGDRVVRTVEDLQQDTDRNRIFGIIRG